MEAFRGFGTKCRVVLPNLLTELCNCILSRLSLAIDRFYIASNFVIQKLLWKCDTLGLGKNGSDALQLLVSVFIFR